MDVPYVASLGLKPVKSLFIRIFLDLIPNVLEAMTWRYTLPSTSCVILTWISGFKGIITKPVSVADITLSGVLARSWNW